MTTIPAERLDRLVARWQTVQGALAQGADQESYVRLSREFAELDQPCCLDASCTAG